MIYAGPGRSVNCVAQTLKFDPVLICEDMPVVDNKYIVLLIILLQVHDIPHSKYRSSVCFVYSIEPGLPGPCDYLRSLPVGLEFSCRGVRSILKNFPQDWIALLEHPRLHSFVIRVCQGVLVGRYLNCCCFSQLITCV